MTEVELLREAAQKMRERACGPIGSSPWSATGRFVYHSGGNPVAEAMGPRNAEHIASWHPAVALAVADILDEDADRLDLHITAWTAPAKGVDSPPAAAWNNPERLAALIEHHFGRSLAVARAYLGGAA